jgi:hypothetical protein
MGISLNKKGFKVLPPWLGTIYGDSVTPDDVDDILTVLTNAENMWCATNMIFGVGGNLIKVWRGWLDFAMKCSEQEYKVSPVGRLKVIIRDGRIQTVREDDGPEPSLGRVCYADGDRYHLTSLQEVRDRVASFFGGWQFSNDPAVAAAALKAVEDPWTVGSSMGLESALKLPGNPFSAPVEDPLSDSAVEKMCAEMDPTELAELVAADEKMERAEKRAMADAAILAAVQAREQLSDEEDDEVGCAPSSQFTMEEGCATPSLLCVSSAMTRGGSATPSPAAVMCGGGAVTPSNLAAKIAEAEECDARAQEHLKASESSAAWARSHLMATKAWAAQQLLVVQ